MPGRCVLIALIVTIAACITIGSAHAATSPAWFGGVRYNATTAGTVALKFARCPAASTPGGKFCAHNGALNLIAAEAIASLKAGSAAKKGPCSVPLGLLEHYSSRAETAARTFYNAAPTASRAPVITAATRATLAWSAVLRCLSQ